MPLIVRGPGVARNSSTTALALSIDLVSLRPQSPVAVWLSVCRDVCGQAHGSISSCCSSPSVTIGVGLLYFIFLILSVVSDPNISGPCWLASPRGHGWRVPEAGPPWAGSGAPGRGNTSETLCSNSSLLSINALLPAGT